MPPFPKLVWGDTLLLKFLLDVNQFIFGILDVQDKLLNVNQPTTKQNFWKPYNPGALNILPNMPNFLD